MYNSRGGVIGEEETILPKPTGWVGGLHGVLHHGIKKSFEKRRVPERDFQLFAMAFQTICDDTTLLYASYSMPGQRRLPHSSSPTVRPPTPSSRQSLGLRTPTEPSAAYKQEIGPAAKDNGMSEEMNIGPGMMIGAPSTIVPGNRTT